jgi:hypothetical protein
LVRRDHIVGLDEISEGSDLCYLVGIIISRGDDMLVLD